MNRLNSTACMMAVLTTPLFADTVQISGNASSSIENSGSSFAGSISYDYNSGSSGTLVITLQNTSASTVGGFLTGFVFDITSADSNASATLTSGTNTNFLNTGTENASPFGSFDAGAALGANWTGGGSPNGGLAVNSTGVFTFLVSASDASSRVASNFLGTGNDFAVRFKGLTGGGSDKILGSEISVVPVPLAAYAGAGMLGLCFGARSIRRR